MIMDEDLCVIKDTYNLDEGKRRSVHAHKADEPL